MVIVSWSEDESVSRLMAHYCDADVESSLKLLPSQSEYSEFVTKLALDHPSIFLVGLPASDLNPIVITPLGAIGAGEDRLDLVLPAIPEFTVGSKKEES
jgi:hypothetical protein